MASDTIALEHIESAKAWRLYLRAYLYTIGFPGWAPNSIQEQYFMINFFLDPVTCT